MMDWEYLLIGCALLIIIAVVKDMFLSDRYDGRNDRPDEPEKLRGRGNGRDY